MKILQVIAYFTPKRGGDVNVCYNISKQLALRGHDVTIITSDFEFDQNYADSIKEFGVRVIPFHCIANLSLFLVSPSIKKWLKANIDKYDIIHMHNYRSYQNNHIHYFARKYKVPYILQAHGSILPIFAKQHLKILYDFVWGNRILQDAAKVIALNKTEVDQYMKMGVSNNKIEVIPNGIDLFEFENLPKKGQFKRKFNIGDNEKIVLYLGRLHKTKGIDLLINAYSELIRELNEVRLVIVGPDDGFLLTLNKKIKELRIKDKVLFTGPLYGHDKLSAYVDADVFILPRYYGLPVTFIESCACGIPIITTTQGDKISWLNKVGYVTEYNKYSLAQAITKVLSNIDLKDEFIRNGKDLIQNKLNWEKLIERLEKLYLSVLVY